MHKSHEEIDAATSHMMTFANEHWNYRGHGENMKLLMMQADEIYRVGLHPGARAY
jgi:hypothetical protein